VRVLNNEKAVLETYVLSGPIFYFDQEVKMMASSNETGVTLPIPHAYFKSVLAERDNGALHMWSFIMKNEASAEPLASFLVPTTKVEKLSGLFIWETLVGTRMENEKNKLRPMWKI
jgi:endonuclease G